MPAGLTPLTTPFLCPPSFAADFGQRYHSRLQVYVKAAALLTAGLIVWLLCTFIGRDLTEMRRSLIVYEGPRSLGG